MLLYLDVCCFNRPWDDQSHDRVRLETEAKLLIQERIRAGSVRLAWSYVLDFECSLNPFVERRAAVMRWRGLATVNLVQTPSILARGKELASSGLSTFDALHVACAEAASAEIFVSTDDRLLRKTQTVSSMVAMLPGRALERIEGWYEDRH